MTAFAARPAHLDEVLPGLSRSAAWSLIRRALERELTDVQKLRKVMPTDETLLSRWWQLSSLLSEGLNLLQQQAVAEVVRSAALPENAQAGIANSPFAVRIRDDGEGGSGPRRPITNNHTNPADPTAQKPTDEVMDPSPITGSKAKPTGRDSKTGPTPDRTQGCPARPEFPSGEATNRSVIINDATTALRSLGYRKAEALAAVNRVEATTTGLDLNALVKASLRSLDINR